MVEESAFERESDLEALRKAWLHDWNAAEDGIFSDENGEYVLARCEWQASTDYFGPVMEQSMQKIYLPEYLKDDNKRND